MLGPTKEPWDLLPLTCVPCQRPFALFAREEAESPRSVSPFLAFPGLCSHRPQPKQTESLRVQRIPPLDAEAPRACALRLSAPPLRQAAPPLSSPVRAQAQSLAADAPANGVRERSAEREGVGPARGVAPPCVGMRLAIGSRGNHGSLPGTSHSVFLAYCKNCTKTGVAGLLILLNCWAQGKEEAESTRRRETPARRLKA